MSITIEEAGLRFGSYNAERLFHAERSGIYKSLGGGIRSVEFVLLSDSAEILLVEAKSSSPKPGNQEDFDAFILNIYEKFTHSIDMFFSVILKRLEDRENEVPECFKSTDYSEAKIKLILVIDGHEEPWLHPIRDALIRELSRQIKTWRLQVAVLNHAMAGKYGLLC